jgi:hypothetical protein
VVEVVECAGVWWSVVEVVECGGVRRNEEEE